MLFLIAIRYHLSLVGKKMDLAKIIGDLKAELQCLVTAINSMEELARVQSLSDSEVRQIVSSPPDPESQGQPQVKRRRGRPRKNPLPSSESSQTSGAGPSNDGSSASAA
jgi:hypothetical protein